MIYWGISANNHDAALAVFDDNTLVFASEAERFSKLKNDPDLHVDLINHARAWGEPDTVCWFENPWQKTLRQLFAGQKIKSNSVKKYLKNYNIDAPIKIVDHHRSHAAAGYYTSKFDDACVLIIDAIGEFQSLSIWQGNGEDLSFLFSLDYQFRILIFHSH